MRVEREGRVRAEREGDTIEVRWCNTLVLLTCAIIPTQRDSQLEFQLAE